MANVLHVGLHIGKDGGIGEEAGRRRAGGTVRETISGRWKTRLNRRMFHAIARRRSRQRRRSGLARTIR